MGTFLAAQGVSVDGPLWSTEALLARPELVRAAHAAYVEAGAEVVTSVTFRAHPGLFADLGRSMADWEDVLRRGVRAAVAGIEQAQTGPEEVWVAGSLAPVGESYRPDAVPDDEVLSEEHGAQAAMLARSGVDLIIVETMVARREAAIAVAAACRTGLPVWCSFVVGPGARLLSGEPLALAVPEVEAVGAQAVLVNCSSLADTEAAVRVLAQIASRPWGAYPNGSSGGPQGGWGPAEPSERFAEAAGHWTSLGARILGSCCMTTPGHTAAIAQALARTRGP